MNRTLRSKCPSTLRQVACAFLIQGLVSFSMLLGSGVVAQAQQVDDILLPDIADQNLGQLNPTDKALDSIIGLEVRPEGVTEVKDPNDKKKKKLKSQKSDN